MKKKAVARMLAAALAGVLGVSTLTGCTFGFASDPDDPNETKKEEYPLIPQRIRLRTILLWREQRLPC